MDLCLSKHMEALRGVVQRIVLTILGLHSRTGYDHIPCIKKYGYDRSCYKYTPVQFNLKFIASTIVERTIRNENSVY